MKHKRKQSSPVLPALLCWGAFMGIIICASTGEFKEPERQPIADIIQQTKSVELYRKVESSEGKHAIIKFVMNDIEGGPKYVKDAGGYAKYGINSKYHPDVDVKNLTEKKALAVYKSKYWDERLNSFKPAFQAVAFDALVNHGNDSDTWTMIDEAKGSPKKLISMRKRYYTRLIEVYPAKAKNKAGWDNRLVKLQQFASK